MANITAFNVNLANNDEEIEPVVAPVMTTGAFKILMLKEFHEGVNNICSPRDGRSGLYGWDADRVRAMFSIACEELEECRDFTQIQAWMSRYDFRMSVQEWVDGYK